ncbi:MAG: hypothetical protein JKY32_08005 [Rhizobiales bacterium]|nr:hypothetical protein [Hyphomicrobiales bacterium]
MEPSDVDLDAAPETVQKYIDELVADIERLKGIVGELEWAVEQEAERHLDYVYGTGT